MNKLIVIDRNIGKSKVYGSMGPDDADSMERFGKGRMHYARQFGDLYKYNYILETLLKKPYTESILYVGCSDDYLRRILHENSVKCKRYVGIDLNLEKLKSALEIDNSIDAEYYCLDASKPFKMFKDDEFEVVLALDIIEHLPTKTDGYNLINSLDRVCSEALIMSTPQMQHNKLGFPDVHNFEFDVKELNSIINSLKYKYSTINKWGIHLSEEEFDKIRKEFSYIDKMNHFLTPKILRGIFASLFTEQSKDVLIHANV